MTQQGADSTALIVSIIALVVAVIAAGFTGWQAVTEHLARTRSPKARWAFEYPPSDRARTWRLHNTGGSIASSIVVRVRYPAREEREAVEQDFDISTPIRPGESAPIPGTDMIADPRLQLRHVGGSYIPVEPGKYEDAWYPQSDIAQVTWRDYRGRSHSEDVRLR